MMAKKAALTVFFPETILEEEIITSTGAKLEKSMCFSPDDVLALAHDADVVLTGPIVPFQRDLIEKLTKCRLIASIGVGYDPIDVAAATDNGICVTNVPDYCIEEVGDYTISLLLACSQKFVQLSNAVKAGKWDRLTQPALPEISRPRFRLSGQVLGLIGLGNIARDVVPKAQPLGLKVIAFDPYVPETIANGLGVEMLDLDHLLEVSDFVSVHAALTPENKYMMSIEQFKKMKPSAYFINVARGALVDEDALYNALSQGMIAGAGIDVMETEPVKSDNPLLKLDNIIITPHTAQYSEEATAELWRKPLEEAARVLNGEWPPDIAFVNPQVKEKFASKWG
ncbi:MAG: C-terminal binding protein [Chloroflexota bacterium]|nr:C-terminal binding protein [Chloroflexota bacterium]